MAAGGPSAGGRRRPSRAVRGRGAGVPARRRHGSLPGTSPGGAAARSRPRRSRRNRPRRRRPASAAGAAAACRRSGPCRRRGRRGVFPGARNPPPPLPPPPPNTRPGRNRPSPRRPRHRTRRGLMAEMAATAATSSSTARPCRRTKSPAGRYGPTVASTIGRGRRRSRPGRPGPVHQASWLICLCSTHPHDVHVRRLDAFQVEVRF